MLERQSNRLLQIVSNVAGMELVGVGRILCFYGASTGYTQGHWSEVDQAAGLDPGFRWFRQQSGNGV